VNDPARFVIGIVDVQQLVKAVDSLGKLCADTTNKPIAVARHCVQHQGGRRLYCTINLRQPHQDNGRVNATPAPLRWGWPYSTVIAITNGAVPVRFDTKSRVLTSTSGRGFSHVLK
jgi:hypothetical protein